LLCQADSAKLAEAVLPERQILRMSAQVSFPACDAVIGKLIELTSLP
jgi:hypothetical protein